jgi:hypothetical protein
MPDKYYPGDQYVDWVGLSLYPQSDIPYPKNILHGTAGAGSFDFVNNWTHKPLMIAEGTWKKDLERCDGIKWINQWFDMKDIPRLKAAVWFHFQKDSANPEETGKSDMDGYDEDELRVFRYRAAKSSVIKELAANNIDFNDDGRADLYDYSVVASAWLTDNTGNHVYTEINGLVVLEAENYSCLTSGSGSMAGVAWQNLEGGNAVGSFMQALPDSGLSASNYADCPAIDYLIFFENTGDYYLDLKASAPDSDGRKFYVMFDGQYAGEFDAKIFFNFSWEDSGIILNIPQAGIYKLSIAAAQDGLKLDRILLSNDPAYNSSTEPLETDNWQGPFVDGDFDADGIVGFSDMEVLIRQWIR